MSENEQMRVLAQQLWKNYMEPKVDRKLALTVRFFRAEVVSNLGNNVLEVKRPTDSTVMELPCTNGMTEAQAGDQCMVFVFGSLSNAIVISDGMVRSFSAAFEEKTVGTLNTLSGDIVSFDNGTEDVPLMDLNVEVQAIQEGSGDPSPDNIRPITGWAGTKLSHCGGNLVPDSWYSTSFSGSGVTGAKEGDTFVLNGVNTSSSGTNWYIKRYGTASEFSLPAGTYTLSGISGPLANNSPYLSLYKRVNDSNMLLVYCQQKAGFTSRTVTLTEYTEHLFLVIAASAGSDVTGYTIKPMLEPGEDASEFSPYGSWNAINVPFPSAAGTVYGGTLDVTNGLLTVTYGQIGSYAGESLPGLWISDRDVYSQGTVPTSGAQVVYELDEPITYQLTPTEVRTLIGENNIWADCGDVTLTYPTWEDSISTLKSEIANLKAMVSYLETKVNA